MFLVYVNNKFYKSTLINLRAAEESSDLAEESSDPAEDEDSLKNMDLDQGAYTTSQNNSDSCCFFLHLCKRCLFNFIFE